MTRGWLWPSAIGAPIAAGGAAAQEEAEQAQAERAKVGEEGVADPGEPHPTTQTNKENPKVRHNAE